MNYEKHYDALITSRKNRSLIEGQYYERHHIIMRSMGGSNDENNLVYLTAREHYLAHWLLWRIHRNRQTAFAFRAFSTLFNNDRLKNRKFECSSRSYAEAKEAFSTTQRAALLGKINTNNSKPVIQKTVNGTFVREWVSAKEAQRTLNISHVHDCRRNERKITGGFHWEYKNGYTKRERKISNRSRKARNCTSVAQFLNDEKIAEFESITQAVYLSGVALNEIKSALTSPHMGRGGGFTWKRI